MPSVHQPDPPGLIHDDLRLLPPWRGSSLFPDNFIQRPTLGAENPLSADVAGRFHVPGLPTNSFAEFIHSPDFIHIPAR